MNITKEEYKQVRIPKGKDKTYIKETLKAEFGEDVVYNKEDNAIILCENSHINNPVLVKLLGEFRVYLQTSLF